MAFPGIRHPVKVFCLSFVFVSYAFHVYCLNQDYQDFQEKSLTYQRSIQSMTFLRINEMLESQTLILEICQSQ